MASSGCTQGVVLTEVGQRREAVLAVVAVAEKKELVLALVVGAHAVIAAVARRRAGREVVTRMERVTVVAVRGEAARVVVALAAAAKAGLPEEAVNGLAGMSDSIRGEAAAPKQYYDTLSIF